MSLGLVVVGLECGGAEHEVVGEAGVARQAGRFAQLCGGGHVGFGEGFVVGVGDQRAVVVAVHKGVEGAEGLVVGSSGLEFLGGHVGRVEVGAGRLVADAFDEGTVAPQPVPRPVVDLDEAAGGLVAVRQGERGLPVPVGLLPEDAVHGLDGLDQETHDLLVVFGEVREVGFEAEDGVLVDEGLHGGSVIRGLGLVRCGVAAGSEGEREEEDGWNRGPDRLRAGVHRMLLGTLSRRCPPAVAVTAGGGWGDER